MHHDARVRKGCLFVLTFGLFVPHTLADFAVCQSGWEWASNTGKQNPCEIAGVLEAECQGFAVYELGPLGPGGNYVTPQKNSSAQRCECNTVMFSLYMACTACQNISTETWSFWSQYCDTVYVTQYPGNIPLNTAVPNWAYLNYTDGDNFDPATAEAAGDQPERLTPVPSTVSVFDISTSSSSSSLISSSSISAGPSTVSTLTGGSQKTDTQMKTAGPSISSLPANSTLSGSPSLTTSMSAGGDQPNDNNNNNNNNNQAKKSSQNVGAIVGSVIGGLAFLATVGVGAWIFLRRQKAPGGDRSGDPGRSNGITVHENDSQPSGMRLYDPDDPFTYPVTTHATPPNKPHYTGAAEL